MDQSQSVAQARRALANASRGMVRVDREVLDAIPVTDRGDRSSRWSGVQHGVLANAVLEQASARNLGITSEMWEVSADGSRLFGDLAINAGSQAFMRSAEEFGQFRGYGGFNPQVMGLHLGVISSNDSSFALTLIVLARILVCSNGMTVEGGHITARRKHTLGIHNELQQVIGDGLDTFVSRVGTLDQTQRQMRELDYGRQVDVDHVFMEAGRRELFPWSKIGQVEQEWREPRHPEFQERTGWSLMNSFTQVAKRFNRVREIGVAEDVRRLVLELAPNHN